MNKYKVFYIFLIINIKLVALSPIFGAEDMVDQEKNMFHEINAILQDLTNKVFTVLKLSEDFMNAHNTGLLLQMHGHLKKITENNYDIYMDVKNASRMEPYKNNSVFNMTETVRQVLNDDYEINQDTNKIVGAKDTQYYLNNTQDKANDRLKTIKLIKNLLRVIDSVDFHIADAFNETSKIFLKTRRLNKKYELKKWDASSAMADLHQESNITRRLYHGISTSIQRFPFMASIHVAKIFTCAGSIVSKDLVVTAASCYQQVYNHGMKVKSSDSLSARVGSVYARRHGTVLPVTTVHCHPDYDPENLRNNIALATVPGVGRTPGARRIPYERSVRPLPADAVVTMLGWGDTDDGVSGETSRLAVTLISLYDVQQCKEAYTTNYVNEENFCAGYTTKGGGACNRDLGGPGIIRGVLTGVVSFGPPVCGTPDAPTVFTRIGHYAGWIDNIAMRQKFATRDSNIESQQVQESRKFQLPIAMEFLKTVVNKIILTAANNEEGPMAEIKNPGNKFYRFLDALKHVDETTKTTLVVNKGTPNLNIQRTGPETDLNTDCVAADDYAVTSTVDWDQPDRPHNHKHKRFTKMDAITVEPLTDVAKLSTIKDPTFLKEIKNIESFLEPKYLSKIRQKLMAAADYNKTEDFNKKQTHSYAKKNTKVRLLNSMDESKQTFYNNFETDHDLSNLVDQESFSVQSNLADEESFSGQFSLDVDDRSQRHTNSKFDETKLRLGVNINT